MTPNLVYVVTVGVLFGAGVTMLLERSLTRVLMGVILVGNGANLLILSGGRLGEPPIVGVAPEERLSDPLPQAMILTAIVITLGLSAFLLAMAYRSWQLVGHDEVRDDVEDRRIAGLAERDQGLDTGDGDGDSGDGGTSDDDGDGGPAGDRRSDGPGDDGGERAGLAVRDQGADTGDGDGDSGDGGTDADDGDGPGAEGASGAEPGGAESDTDGHGGAGGDDGNGDGVGGPVVDRRRDEPGDGGGEGASGAGPGGAKPGDAGPGTGADGGPGPARGGDPPELR